MMQCDLKRHEDITKKRNQKDWWQAIKNSFDPRKSDLLSNALKIAGVAGLGYVGYKIWSQITKSQDGAKMMSFFNAKDDAQKKLT